MRQVDHVGRGKLDLQPLDLVLEQVCSVLAMVGARGKGAGKTRKYRGKECHCRDEFGGSHILCFQCHLEMPLCVIEASVGPSRKGWALPTSAAKPKCKP